MRAVGEKSDTKQTRTLAYESAEMRGQHPVRECPYQTDSNIFCTPNPPDSNGMYTLRRGLVKYCG